MNAVSVAARIGLATILLFSLVTIAYAGAPALPCEFYGKVIIEGSPAPVGTIVVAKVGEQERGQFLIEQEGLYGGPGTFDKRLKVVVEESDLSVGTPTITFWVDGQKAWQETSFQPGVSLLLDLSVGGNEPETTQIDLPAAVPTTISEDIAISEPVVEPVAEPVAEPTTAPEVIEPEVEIPPSIPPMPSLPGIPDAPSDVPVSSDELFADFDANPVAGSPPLVVQFTDLSTGYPTMWSWDFGDGTSDYIGGPIHVYEYPGVYTVSLTVAGQDGSSDTETKVAFITVSGEGDIVANFLASPLTGDSPLTVQFTDISTGNPTMWSWDFGDGSTDLVANPTHIYQSPGTYTVSMTASSQDGSSDTETKIDYITVSGTGSLVAEFAGEPTTGNSPLSVYFTDKSSGTPTSWFWDFGDGLTDDRKDTVHIYNQPGLFTVSLTVTDENGEKSTKQKEAYISVLTPGELIADFSAELTTGIIPLGVQFTDLTVGGPTLWSWDFGDGTSDMVSNPAHEYNTPGNYTVTLTVSNQEGGIATKTRKDYIKVQAVPTPVPTLTVLPIPQVPQTFYGTVDLYGAPISVGGTVEAMVSGYNLTSQFNPIKTAKGTFGKMGTFSPKLQVQGIPVGTEIEFYVADEENRLSRAYIKQADGSLAWSEPYDPGKEKELHLVITGHQPTVIPTIPITPIPTNECQGVPAIPMTFTGDLHITTGKEYLESNSSCTFCAPNAPVGTTIEARIEDYDVTGPSNPIALTSAGYFGGGNSSWTDKLVLQPRCVPEESNITFWITAPTWQRPVQAYLYDGSDYYWETPYQASKEATVHLWVGPVPTQIYTPTPTPTPHGWSPQKFYGKAEFNGYPLREGDRVMAMTEGVDLTSPTNPISVMQLGEYGDPVGNELLMVEVPYYALNQNAPINFWIKPQGFEFWYKAWVKNPLSGEPWKQSYPFTPGSITNLDLYSNDREEFMYFYDIVTTIKNAILPEDYTGW